MSEPNKISLAEKTETYMKVLCQRVADMPPPEYRRFLESQGYETPQETEWQESMVTAEIYALQ